MEWFIKANLNLAILSAVFVLLFRFTTKHQLVRWLLLCIPMLAMLLPWVGQQSGVVSLVEVKLPEIKIAGEVVGEHNHQVTVMGVMLWVYYIGVGFSLLLSLFSVLRLLLGKQQSHTAYSFWRKIVLPETTPEKNRMMLLHEEAHVKQWHSVDTLYYAILRAVFWFNPAVYLLFRFVKEAHEYSADAYALKQLNNKEDYCNLILDETFGLSGVSELAHSFHSHVSLFNRIKMITQTQPQSVPGWKKIVALPVLAAFFMVSFISYQSSAQQTTNETVFTKTEQMPEYPGGMEAMMKFIQTELQYPKECREKKIEGRVILQFIVDENGDITDIENMKKEVDERLVNEAIRVVKKMPKWQPGVQDHKAVKVKFTLPLVFKLS